MSHANVSLMVPTLNRPNFLGRLIDYYQLCGFKGHILVADSSDSHLAQINQRRVAKASQNGLNIQWIDAKGANDSQAIWQLIMQVRTVYAVFVADDDLIVPEGLSQAVEFLSDNPDYSACGGQGYIFTIKNDDAYGEVCHLMKYPLPYLPQESVVERIGLQAKEYRVSLFCIAHIDTWRKVYVPVSKLTDKRFTELLPSFLIAVEGKIGMLPETYLLRQTHGSRYFLPHIDSWTSSSLWQQNANIFIEELIKGLMNKGLSTQEATDLANVALNQYLKEQQKQSKYNLKDLLNRKVDNIKAKIRFYCDRSLIDFRQTLQRKDKQ